MKKKILFYAFTLFVMLFTLVAWSYAKVELVEIQEQQSVDLQKEPITRKAEPNLNYSN